MAKMSTAVALLREKIQTTWGVRPAPAEAFGTVAGEIPRGVMTEIVGPATSGRTAALYSVLARATEGQEFCALLDTDNRFDPLTAAAAGVRLSQLLWVRCGGSVEHALKAADMLANGGGFGMIAIDMADTPQAAVQRVPLAAWFRLRRGVENTRTALVVLAQRVHAKSCSAVKIELERGRAVWRGRMPGGLLERFECAGQRVQQHQPRAVEFRVCR
ncbi:MAG: hypothetical protein RL328_2145 [Acidobacteriota bacterium]